MASDSPAGDLVLVWLFSKTMQGSFRHYLPPITLATALAVAAAAVLAVAAAATAAAATIWLRAQL